MTPVINHGKKLMIMAAGTGGHIFPGLAIAETMCAQHGFAVEVFGDGEIARQPRGKTAPAVELHAAARVALDQLRRFIQQSRYDSKIAAAIEVVE